MTKQIGVERFNNCFNSGTARFQRFHGGKARHFKDYLPTHLNEEKPDTVILQVGGMIFLPEERIPPQSYILQIK